MEPNELKVLHRCSRDIKISLLVSSTVLQRLESRGMITRKDREFLTRLQDGADRNPKLVEILKKKKGGFHAFTETLLVERSVNEHYVKKMNNLLKEWNSKIRHENHTHLEIKSENKALKEKIETLQETLETVSVLTLGLGFNSDKHLLNMEDVIEELQKLRAEMDKSESKTHLPLTHLYLDCKSCFNKQSMAQEKLYQNSKQQLQKEKDQLTEEKIFVEAELQMLKKYQDDIICDLVNQKVKERLLRVHLLDQSDTQMSPDEESMDTQRTQFTTRENYQQIQSYRTANQMDQNTYRSSSGYLSTLQMNTSDHDETPRTVYNTFHINSIENCQISNIDENFNVNIDKG